MRALIRILAPLALLVSLLAAYVPANSQPVPASVSSSYSRERCTYQNWSVSDVVRNIEGPCFFWHMRAPGFSFIREGIVLNAQLKYYDGWRSTQLHFASCAVFAEQKGAVCGVTHFGADHPSDNVWYRWAIKLEREADGKFRLVKPLEGRSYWIDLAVRDKKFAPDGRPLIMPRWNKSLLDALKTDSPLPSPVRAKVQMP